MRPWVPGFQIVTSVTESTNIDAAAKPSSAVGMARM